MQTEHDRATGEKERGCEYQCEAPPMREHSDQDEAPLMGELWVGPGGDRSEDDLPGSDVGVQYGRTGE